MGLCGNFIFNSCHLSFAYARRFTKLMFVMVKGTTLFKFGVPCFVVKNLEAKF